MSDTPRVRPDDDANRTLVSNVHPAEWHNPTPAARYNLVVLGGGPAGLVAALGAAGLGAKVALVEKHLLGGDCLNGGCVPSKALLRPAHLASAARQSAPFGVHTTVNTDFSEAMARMRSVRAGISSHDSAERLAGEGIDVFLGTARFTGRDTIAVEPGGHPNNRPASLTFARALIATGARAIVPPIPGLDEIGALTNESLFELTELPARTAILGAGVIGSEMAQALAGFGSQVTLIDLADRVLSREDPEATALLQAAMERDGVTLRLGARVQSARLDGPERVLSLEAGSEVRADAVLVAVGRQPNVELDLEAAGIEATKAGIVVDRHLQTTNPDVYAAGDVCSGEVGQPQLTHAADHHARMVVRNALFFGRATVDDLVIPRVTYTRPEVASVGVSAADAANDPALTAFSVGLDETDRGRTDGLEGFVKVFADGKGRIHGAVVVGEQAGEWLAPITLAMTHGLTLGQVASTVHPYPTASEAFFKVASAWNRTRLKPWMKTLTTRLMAWRR